MSRRYTSGFEILDMDDDPAPGDPDQIDQLAQRYEAIRDDARIAVQVLGKGGQLEDAKGEAASKLLELLKGLPDKLQATVDSFDAAALAYREYAADLRKQQGEIDRAMDQAGPVAGAARQEKPTSAADATEDQRAQNQKQADQIDEAQSTLSAAQRLARDARALREQASSKASDALDEAAAKSIKPRNFLQKIGDFFTDHPFLQIIIDLLIAVVAVIAPVVGLLLAAGSLILSVASQAANGKFKLGTLLVGLVSLVPGGKLIGSLASGAEKVARPLVESIRTTANGIGKVVNNNRAVTGIINIGNKAGGAGKTGSIEFTKGIVQDVATTGLNNVTTDPEPFNPATIFGGAAAGGAVGAGIGFGKSRGQKGGAGSGEPGPSTADDGIPATAGSPAPSVTAGGPATTAAPTTGASPTPTAATPSEPAPASPAQVTPTPAPASRAPAPPAPAPATADKPAPVTPAPASPTTDTPAPVTPAPNTPTPAPTTTDTPAATGSSPDADTPAPINPAPTVPVKQAPAGPPPTTSGAAPTDTPTVVSEPAEPVTVSRNVPADSAPTPEPAENAPVAGSAAGDPPPVTSPATGSEPASPVPGASPTPTPATTVTPVPARPDGPDSGSSNPADDARPAPGTGTPSTTTPAGAPPTGNDGPATIDRAETGSPADRPTDAPADGRPTSGSATEPSADSRPKDGDSEPIEGIGERAKKEAEAVAGAAAASGTKIGITEEQDHGLKTEEAVLDEAIANAATVGGVQADTAAEQIDRRIRGSRR